MMETIVYKFGGASVKGANEVKNVARILKQVPQDKQCIVIFSAMGKTTNRLESLLKTYPAKEEDLQVFISYHSDIVKELYDSEEQRAIAITKLQILFDELNKVLQASNNTAKDERYDLVVPFGERVSTCIISQYLNSINIANTELDARKVIITDSNFRSANVDWQATEAAIKAEITEQKLVITQGFIGASKNSGKPVTLGREGSDYSAAIFAYALNAKSVTIWKDVPGVLNADPKYFSNAVKIPFISYWDATELAYYGASVIHPKTIKPLQNKNIPLFVRSFLNPEAEGTTVASASPLYNKETKVPSYIFKPKQILVSISPRDFSFIEEGNLSYIFKIFSQHGIHINMMQNSALSFSVCVDDNKGDFEASIADLKEQYKVKYNENVTLVTIRHYTEKTIEEVLTGKEILLEQKSRYTAQFAVIDPEINDVPLKL